MHGKPFGNGEVLAYVFLRKRDTASMHRRTSLLIREGVPKPVQTPYLGQIYIVPRCCLRCGRVEDIGHEHIEKCVDCEAMGFHID